VSATIQSDGSFAAVWRANHIGRFAIRAVVVSPAVAQTATTTPSLTITVYRPSMATQYGPGFYGHRTACGEKLTKATIGVANRTLRCGTNVAVYYRGRTMIVPVIDRGPYANGADWDLTEATGQAMGIGGTAQIGAVSLPAP
jgi:rare lipoprotein A (peptidoglycan hydrolase)